MGMCTKEEVIKVVADSEQRLLAVMHTELQKLREEVRHDREQSHNALAKTISNFGSEVITATKDLREFIIKRGAEIDMLIIWKSVHEVEAKEINNKVTEIQTTLSRLMWIVITGVAIAVLGLVLK
jgi:hypothetical protein